jgi:hypothetical protein
MLDTPAPNKPDSNENNWSYKVDTSGHSVFAIAELRLAIIDAVVNENPFYPRRARSMCQTLAALARVSKVVSESALDQLWSVIPGFLPLLRLFPEDALLVPSLKNGQWVRLIVLASTLPPVKVFS